MEPRFLPPGASLLFFRSPRCFITKFFPYQPLSAILNEGCEISVVKLNFRNTIMEFERFICTIFHKQHIFNLIKSHELKRLSCKACLFRGSQL